MNVTYKSHGTPLEDHQLTRRDHHWQRTLVEIKEQHARRLAAKAPPMSEETVERIAALLSYPTPDTQIMRWRVRLSCGHIIEARRNCDMQRPADHGCNSQLCPECGMDPAAIVAYEPLGLVAEPAYSGSARSRAGSSPTKAELRAENARLREETARLQVRLRELGGTPDAAERPSWQ